MDNDMISKLSTTSRTMTTSLHGSFEKGSSFKTTITARNISRSNKNCNNDNNYREWNFNVLCYEELLSTEILALTGNCSELGNWKPELCVLLDHENGTNQWNTTVRLPSNKTIEYRYFICVINSETDSILIRRWETHLKPRHIEASSSETSSTPPSISSTSSAGFEIDAENENYESSSNVSYDIFGNAYGLNSISRGWLTKETILQLKIYNNACIWQNSSKSYNNIHIKITPMRMENGGIRPVFIPIESSTKAIVEYVKFDIGTAVLKIQSEEIGIPWNPNDIIIFHITVIDIKNVAYLIEIFGLEEESINDCGITTAAANEINTFRPNTRNNYKKFPKHLGYYYLLPDLLKRSEGDIRLPITNSMNHHKLGTLNVSYLKIKPLLPTTSQPPTSSSSTSTTTTTSSSSSLTSKLNLNLRSTSTKFWKSHWTGLDIGHRGSGVSFRVQDMYYPENTIASFKNAARYGADIIELDVHVTKDGIPIVYHDFHVNISYNDGCGGGATTQSTLPHYGSDLIPILIKDLTYNELKNLKTYHLLDGSIRKTPTFENLQNPNEYNLFPKLEDILDNEQKVIDSHVGLDIEIKWPQQLIDGSWESQQTIDKNFYCDCILNVILRKAAGRCILLTCFDADICTMLRFKQNIYPILFLTLGPTQRYPLYMDPRCNSIRMASCMAQSMEFLGIIPHTEDLLNDSTQITLVKKLNQIIFCWGDDSNCVEIINKLKQMGLDGIIYDRVDQFVGIENKRKIFWDNNDNQNDDDDDVSSHSNNRSNEFFKLQYIYDDDDENDADDKDECDKNKGIMEDSGMFD